MKFRRNPEFWLTLACVTAYYLFVAWFVGFFDDPGHFLLGIANDGAEFVNVSDWLLGVSDGRFIDTRTYLYPLVIAIARLPAGLIGVWVVQAALWMMSAMIFWTNLATLIPGHRWLRIICMILFCACLTPIYLSLLVLSETLSLFIFALMSLVVVQYWQNKNFAVAAISLLTILATVTKPNFQLIYLSVSALFFAGKYFGKLNLSWPRLVASVILPALLLIPQYAFNHAIKGKFQFSALSNWVLQDSLYTQVVSEVTGRPDEEVRIESHAQNPSNGEMAKYFLARPLLTAERLMWNLVANIRNVFHVKEPATQFEDRWRHQLNDFYKVVHILMLFVIFSQLRGVLLLREDRDWQLILLYLVFMTGFLPSSISRWAADRWASPFLVVWPILYVISLSRINFYKLKVFLPRFAQ